jgi:hypothetical protein
MWRTRGNPPNETDDLPFTRRTERFTWEKDQCTGSTVEWQHAWRAKADGTLLKSEPAQTITMVRGPITIEVPPELTPNKDAVYHVVARRKPVGFEPEFRRLDDRGTISTAASMDATGIDTSDGGEMKLTNGTASTTLEWPASAPALELVLMESVRNPPGVSLAFTRSVKARMPLSAVPADGKHVLFKP